MMVLLLASAFANATDVASPEPPAAVQRLLEDYADPRTDDGAVGRSLIRELEKLPTGERHRYDDRFRDALERRLAPAQCPRAAHVLGDVRALPRPALRCLEKLLSDETSYESDPEILVSGYFFNEQCPFVDFKLEVEWLSPPTRQQLLGRLSQALPGRPWAARLRLIRTLHELGEEAAGLDLLLGDLSAADEPRRFQAAMLLAETRLPVLLGPMRTALADESPRVRGTALAALGEIGERQSLPDTRRLLKDFTPLAMFPKAKTERRKPSSVAGMALVAMGMIGGRDVVEDLVGALGDPRTAEDACDALSLAKKRLSRAPRTCEERSWRAWLADGGVP